MKTLNHKPLPRMNAGAKTLAIVAALTQSSCAVFGGATQYEASRPIENPFGDMYSSADPTKGLIVRTKRGQNSVEVELPGNPSDRTDLVMPLNPNEMNSSTTAPLPNEYAGVKAGMMDREIASTFPKSNFEDTNRRSEIEKRLGVMEAEDATPNRDTSYLARVDYVKRLFKEGRFEAGLIEIDQLLRLFPHRPQALRMRGTLWIASITRNSRLRIGMRPSSSIPPITPSSDWLKCAKRNLQNRRMASP